MDQIKKTVLITNKSCPYAIMSAWMCMDISTNAMLSLISTLYQSYLFENLSEPCYSLYIALT